jgi:hypothetical protein
MNAPDYLSVEQLKDNEIARLRIAVDILREEVLQLQRELLELRAPTVKDA